MVQSVDINAITSPEEISNVLEQITARVSSLKTASDNFIRDQWMNMSQSQNIQDRMRVLRNETQYLVQKFGIACCDEAPLLKTDVSHLQEKLRKAQEENQQLSISFSHLTESHKEHIDLIGKELRTVQWDMGILQDELDAANRKVAELQVVKDKGYVNQQDTSKNELVDVDAFAKAKAYEVLNKATQWITDDVDLSDQAFAYVKKKTQNELAKIIERIQKDDKGQNTFDVAFSNPPEAQSGEIDSWDFPGPQHDHHGQELPEGVKTWTGSGWVFSGKFQPQDMTPKSKHANQPDDYLGSSPSVSDDGDSEDELEYQVSNDGSCETSEDIIYTPATTEFEEILHKFGCTALELDWSGTQPKGCSCRGVEKDAEVTNVQGHVTKTVTMESASW